MAHLRGKVWAERFRFVAFAEERVDFVQLRHGDGFPPADTAGAKSQGTSGSAYAAQLLYHVCCNKFQIFHGGEYSPTVAGEETGRSSREREAGMCRQCRRFVDDFVYGFEQPSYTT